MQSLQFPFEKYLSHDLPNYDHEWNIIILKIVLTSIIFLVVLPSLIKGDGNEQHQQQQQGQEVSSKKKHQPICYNILLLILNLIYILLLFTFIVLSPNNTTTARRVYIAPLLTSSECQMIIDMATLAAERNVQKAQHSLQSSSFSTNDNKDDENENDEKEKLQKILSWPQGWKKDRHKHYPTTDLNVAVDFMKEDLDKIATLLNARLSPLLAKIYGISQDSIRADDMFVVRYDGDGQQALLPHTDHSHLSFNVLLNDDFVGGGTKFYNRLEQTSFVANPKPGEVIINNSMVTHEGLATSKGTRYILVGFMQIDLVDPFTGVKTGTPLHASYLSFPWISFTLQHQIEIVPLYGTDNRVGLNHRQQVGFLDSAIRLTSTIGDVLAPHGIVRLVEESKANQYRSDLDQFYIEHGDKIQKSTWFKGQMIFVDLSGRMAGEWGERKSMIGKFGEL